MAKTLQRSENRAPLAAACADALSVDRYRPMLRLLDDSDFQFLAAQPGFDPKVAARLRKQRCMIFGCYLTSLGEDFRKACGALRAVMVQSAQDRPDLAGLLLRRQLTFAWYSLLVRGKLILYRWGFGSVEVDRLMGMFETVREELRSSFPPLDSTAMPEGSYLRIGAQ